VLVVDRVVVTQQSFQQRLFVVKRDNSSTIWDIVIKLS